jgi:hypothetical protein
VAQAATFPDAIDSIACSEPVGTNRALLADMQTLHIIKAMVTAWRSRKPASCSAVFVKDRRLGLWPAHATFSFDKQTWQ